MTPAPAVPALPPKPQEAVIETAKGTLVVRLLLLFAAGTCAGAVVNWAARRKLRLVIADGRDAYLVADLLAATARACPGVQFVIIGPGEGRIARLSALTNVHILGPRPYEIVPAYVMRPVHVFAVMFLAFLLFPVARRFRDRVMWWDWLLAAATVGVIGYILWQGDTFGDRAVMAERADVIVGVVFIVLLLEATRRTTGMIMPGVAITFILYALLGHLLPAPWTHRGYALEDLVGHLYMTLEGVFGTTVDVSSSLIILFTIYGAVLMHSGAGKFFIDFSFAAMGGKKNSAGRAVVLSSFLMGGPSGSGVATTVTIGTVAYPLLKRAGYERNAAGGLLAAGGLGAIISPPVLGAAAFLIAEYLKISYLDVIWMAAIPTILYYFAILIMVELDARKYGAVGIDNELLVAKGELWRVTKTYWYHFSSLISIIGLHELCPRDFPKRSARVGCRTG